MSKPQYQLGARAGSRKVLEPDEIIEAGRPLTIKPSKTSMVALRSIVNQDNDYDVIGTAREHFEELSEWPSLIREMFARLYDDEGCSAIKEEDRATWAVVVFGVLETRPEWSELKAAATHCKRIAAEATVSLAEAAAKAANLGVMPQDESAAEDPQKIEQHLKTMAQLILENGGSEKEAQEVINEIGEKTGKAITRRRKVEESISKMRTTLVGAVKTTLMEANKIKASIDAFEALGFSREGPGSIEEVAPEMMELDARMLAILRYAGRFKEAADGLLAKSNGCDVVGVQSTGDIAKVTPKTMGEIASGGLRGLMTLRDLSEHAAQGWEQRDRAPKNGGDVGILVDRSGSMSGDREHRARGLAVASLISLFQQGRRIAAGSFAGTNDATVAVIQPDDRVNLVEAVKTVCRKAGGDTDVDYALMVMRQKLGLLKDADILIITDGYFEPVDESVIATLGDARLFGVMLDAEMTGHDEFHACWDMAGDVSQEQAAEVISAMKKKRGKK